MEEPLQHLQEIIAALEWQRLLSRGYSKRFGNFGETTPTFVSKYDGSRMSSEKQEAQEHD